ncbi:MAG TPA: hypothetical protein VKZ79_03540 [Alphaproteobacteria bacterium]|nr:hypothetical protein [Alphaproteobacteria bacterium]
MIAIELDSIDAVRARLAAIPADTAITLRAAGAELACQIRSAAENNVSGGLLQARSGKLRDSLAVATSTSGTAIGFSVQAITPYAAFQEFGFSGTESVREFLRRQSMVFGRTIAPKEVTVRAHDRQIDYPGRSYLRSALAQFAPTIHDVLSSAMAEVLKS